MMDFLNKDVIIESENVIIDGLLEGYTIEKDRYYIGIRINKWHKSAWKKLLAGRQRLVLESEIEHAAV